MDSIFKNGQGVWFTWEFEGKPYESHGIIDEVYYFNDVRKHKYKIIDDASGKSFYIWENKISFYKKEDRDKLRCVDCKYNKDVISIGRCDICCCSHRLFELSEKEKEYVHDDVVATMSYIHELHKNGFYGIGTDTRILINNIKEDNKMKNEQKKRNRNIIKTEKYQRTIENIIFNGPAVIVKFDPTIEDMYYDHRTKGDKVVVVCKDGDKYDMKTGFLLAILKEFLDNQSYGNILEKLDSFDAFDIPQVGKDDGFKFKVGDIVRLKTGTKKYKVIGQDTINDIKRYRLLSYNSNSNYTFYERENRLILADEVYRK